MDVSQNTSVLYQISTDEEGYFYHMAEWYDMDGDGTPMGRDRPWPVRRVTPDTHRQLTARTVCATRRSAGTATAFQASSIS